LTVTKVIIENLKSVEILKKIQTVFNIEI